MLARRCLLITSDDYGYSNVRDDGILACYRSGAITGAVLMVNGVSAVSAVAKAKQAGMPLDLHLNITEGIPVGPGPYRTLVGNDGFMLGKMGIKVAQAKGQLDYQEVCAEIQAQIDKFVELTGRTPVKVDGHQHAHVVPGIVDVFAKVLRNNGIQLTRLPIETEVKDHTFVSEVRGKFLKEMVKQSIDARPVFNKNQIGYPSGFAGLRTMSREMTVSSLQTSILQAFTSQVTSPVFINKENQGQTGSFTSMVLKLKPVSDSNSSKAEDNEPASDDIFCELMVHPGNKTADIGGTGAGPDGFSQSSDREHEMMTLLEKDMKQFYERENIRLVSFHDIEVVNRK